MLREAAGDLGYHQSVLCRRLLGMGARWPSYTPFPGSSQQGWGWVGSLLWAKLPG
jgi:hypothetical protein